MNFILAYACWERVVIVFVSQRMCCILAILTVFVLYSGCSYCILGHSYIRWDWGWYEWTRTQYEWRWNVPETPAKYLFVSIFMLIRICLTPGVLIRTYSYYFLTQFGLFLFVRVKYYVELSSGRTIFVLLTMPNWKKKRFYAFDPPTVGLGH